MPAAIASDLRGLLPRGALVYTLVVSETRTGMACRLLVLVVVAGEILQLTRAVAAELRLEMHQAQLIFLGTREAAGGALVAQLGRTLYADPRALRHQSLGEVRA
jgi:hypothetical protein